MTKRIALAAVTIAVALLLLTAFSLQSVLYSQITQQSYAQEPAASPIIDGNASFSTTTTDNNNTTTDRISPEQNASEDQSFEAENSDNLTATPEPLQSLTNDDTGVRVAKAEGNALYGNILLQNIESEEYDDLDELSELEIEDGVYSDGDEVPSSSSPVSVGTYSSSSPPPGNSSSSSPFVEPGPLPVEPDGDPGGQPGEPGGPTEPQQPPPPPQTVDNNLTQTDGILTATINGANFVRNQTIEVEGKVDDEVITPESGVWITVKDSTNETTHAKFVPLNAADKSFSASLVAGYYDGNSYGFYKPMSVSGKNYTMTVVYNTDNGPSSTPSGNNKSSLEVQFVFAYDHSSTTPPPVSTAVTAEEDTGPASGASQFAGNQSTTGNQSMTTTTTNMTTTAPAPPPTKTNGLLTATINGTHFTTNQTIAVNGTVREAAGPFIAVYVELKDPHNDTLASEFAPIVRSNKSGSDNKTSFSYSLVAGDDNSDSDGHNRRFWKPMNETGNNYTMIVGYATPAPSSSSSPGSVAAVGGGEYSRSEVQFVFAYDHLLPPEEEGAAAVATTTTTTPAEKPVVEPEVPEEEVSEEDGKDCDNSYPDECIPPPPPDLECGDISEDGFEVRRSDPHGFDDDNDGVGCETAPQA